MDDCVLTSLIRSPRDHGGRAASCSPSENSSAPFFSATLRSRPDGSHRLTAVLTSRFLINLQKAKIRLTSSARSMSQASDTLVFEPGVAESVGGFVGSLGAQISFEKDEDEVEEDDQEKL